jgi:hypothetical protein
MRGVTGRKMSELPDLEERTNRLRQFVVDLRSMPQEERKQALLDNYGAQIDQEMARSLRSATILTEMTEAAWERASDPREVFIDIVAAIETALPNKAAVAFTLARMLVELEAAHQTVEEAEGKLS